LVHCTEKNLATLHSFFNRNFRPRIETVNRKEDFDAPKPFFRRLVDLNTSTVFTDKASKAFLVTKINDNNAISVIVSQTFEIPPKTFFKNICFQQHKVTPRVDLMNLHFSRKVFE
jgi:hypothetical protein